MGGLNPNIILSIGQNAQQQQPPNLLGQYQAIQQIQANKMAMQAQQQNMMLAGIKQQSAQVELGQQQLAAQQQQQAVEALSNAGGDVDKATAQLLAVGNPQGLTLQKHRQDVIKQMADIQKAKADMDRTQAETQINKLGHAAALMSGVLDEKPELQGQVYQARRALAIQSGLATPDDLPEVWNDQTKQKLAGMQDAALNAKDKLQQKLEAAKAVEQIRHNSAEEQLTQFRDVNTAQNQSANLAESTRYHNIEAKQRGQQISIEGMNAQTARGRLLLSQKENGQQFGDPLQGMSQAQMNMAQKYANGDFKLPPAGSRAPGAQAIRQAALALNPNLSDDTFTVKHDFNDPKGKGGSNLATIGRIVGHIGRFEKNSGAMSAMESGSYGMGATLTGKQKDTAIDAHGISAELEKLVSGGVGTKEQVQEWQHALRSTTASVRQEAINEISQLVGSQYEAMNQTYKAQTQEDLPLAKYVTPAGRQWLKAKGVNVQGTESGAAAGSGASPGVTAAPGVPAEVQRSIMQAIPKGAKIKRVVKVSD
jgi:hypothetical protein